MQPSELVLALEDYFGQRLPQLQSEFLVKKMSRFSESQLQQIYEKALETCKYLFARKANPIAQLFDVAAELGFVSKPTAEFKPHAWQGTDCRLCAGSGMIAVFFEPYLTTEKKLERRITRMMPYAGLNTTDYQYEHLNEYCSMSRCSCSAGDADTLPRGWPKLKASMKPKPVSESQVDNEVPL